MNESQLWELHCAAREAFEAEPSAEREAIVVETFAAFAAAYIGDPVAAHEETEELRRKLREARGEVPVCERLVPRWA